MDDEQLTRIDGIRGAMTCTSSVEDQPQRIVMRDERAQGFARNLQVEGFRRLEEQRHVEMSRNRLRCLEQPALDWRGQKLAADEALMGGRCPRRVRSAFGQRGDRRMPEDV